MNERKIFVKCRKTNRKRDFQNPLGKREKKKKYNKK